MMRAAIIFLAVVLSFVACTTTSPSTASTEEKGWVLVSNAAGGFSVLMPAQPKENIDELKGSNAPPIKVHVFEASPNPSLALDVIYNDYPESLRSTAGVGTRYFFDTMQQGHARNLGKPNLIYSREGSFNGHPTRQFCFEVPQEQTRHESRVIVVRHRMYHLYVVSRLDIDASRETETFFDSFRLLYD